MRQRTASLATLTLLFACCIVGWVAPTAGAQDPGWQDQRSSIVRCGKAQRAARLAKIPGEAIPSAAYRETLADTDVEHYDLEIDITDIDPGSNSCTFVGSNVMTIRSKSEGLSEFSFRLRSQFEITGAYVDGVTPVTVTTASISTRVVTLDRTYGMDEVFTLTIEYAGPTVSAAFGSIEVSTQFGGGGAVVATLSEPYYAYTWWPAKDGDLYQSGDNSDKATIDLAITVPDTYTVAANGLLQSVTVPALGRKRFQWSSDYPTATYLVAFGATEYNTWSATYTYPGGEMPVEFYIYPGLDTSGNRAGWELVIDMLEVFRPLFGEYPFVDEKYGLYNFPFGGGMEHQTITGQSGFGQYLTAHEVAHQWWGDAVTCKTWNDIWLNEGSASYAEALWDENKAGSSGLAALKARMASMKYTGGGSVYVYDDEVDELWEIFNGGTSYDKGAWVLHMLRHVLGDDNFFDALGAYRAAYEGSAATTQDFQDVCENFYGGESLEWFFQEWVYGEYLPNYRYGWSSVEVNGQDYLLLYVDQVQSASRQRFTMPIDIVVDGVTTYVVYNDADPEHFVIAVDSPPTSVALDPDAWILWNSASGTSYVPGPPKIVQTTPSPGAVTPHEDLLDLITISFHKPVDVADTDFSLVGDTSGVRVLTVQSSSNVNPVVLQIATPLPPDTYTLTIGDGVAAVDSGMALDGEVADATDPGSFPSGDGVAGGDAVIRFSVTFGGMSGDFDGDGDVDLEDADQFFLCFTDQGGGPIAPECVPGDMDQDDDIDCLDWDIFVELWTGPPATPPEFSICNPDCNGNGIADDVDIATGTSFDLDGNGIPDECDCAATADPQQESDRSSKNRYLSFVPANPGQQTALRVTFSHLPAPFGSFQGETMWVGEWFLASEVSGESEPVSPPYFTAARLECEPFYTDWGAVGLVHVLHQAIVPQGEYDVQAIDQVCGIYPDITEEDFSVPFRIINSAWGDLVGGCGGNPPCLPPDGLIDFIDIASVVDKFRNLLAAPTKARADIAEGTPDLVVDFIDITYAVGAFRREAYPFDFADPCPDR